MSDVGSETTAPGAQLKKGCRPEAGVVETLCHEIGYPFDDAMETPHTLVSFARVLFFEVNDMHSWRTMIAERGLGEVQGFNTSEAADAFKAVREFLENPLVDRERRCAELHNGVLCQPDDGPCNRFIEMLSSIVSAIRFGLEFPCRSRHAAHAADHIWSVKYGISLFDNYTPHWSKDYARRLLAKALTAPIQVGTTPEAEAPGGEGQKP